MGFCIRKLVHQTIIRLPPLKFNEKLFYFHQNTTSGKRFNDRLGGICEKADLINKSAKRLFQFSYNVIFMYPARLAVG
jgi:hypothetical protein